MFGTGGKLCMRHSGERLVAREGGRTGSRLLRQAHDQRRGTWIGNGKSQLFEGPCRPKKCARYWGSLAGGIRAFKGGAQPTRWV